MKFKKIILTVFIILIILTIGSVNASQDNDCNNLTLDENTNIHLEQTDEINEDVLKENTLEFNSKVSTSPGDFTPQVDENVNDYYTYSINLTIPDSINNGQIILNLKYKGNHSTNLPNMNVTSDFGSNAIYKFNVSDIKTSYPDKFTLSFSNLGFYEGDGKYELNITYDDGINTLNIINKTLNVKFLEDIIIKINETSRYTYTLNFASVKISKPTNAYAELYIDGELYSHKANFENGIITFTSSQNWTSGNHTAEIKVIQVETGMVLNSLVKIFNTITNTPDVKIKYNETFKEDENVILILTVPDDGRVLIETDSIGTVYDLTYGLNTINLGILSSGNHTLWVFYENNDTGSFYNGYLEVFVSDEGYWVSVPNPLILNYNDRIGISLDENVTGYAIVNIDNIRIVNLTLVNGSAEFNLTGYVKDNKIKYGVHTYNITYYSTSGDHRVLSRNGTFNITYLFKDDICSQGYPLKEYYNLTVFLPDDAIGIVRLNFTDDDKTYVSEVKNGMAKFIVNNLTMNDHRLIISYSGDNNYPEARYSSIFKVNYYAVIGKISDMEKYISLMLPDNANGNLTIYNDNRDSQLLSVKVNGNKTVIDLTNLSVGIYQIRAYYEGDDYSVKDFSAFFRIMPKVYISQNITMGDNGNVYLDLDNSTGYVVVTLDGLDPKVMEIKNGAVNYTFSTEGYCYGNHTVNFLYFGKSFDGFIFYNEDRDTQINYDLHILPKKTVSYGQSNNKEVLVYIRHNETGSVLPDATGSVEFYVNGVKYNDLEVKEGIARFEYSYLEDGEYVLTWVYSGDNKYASSSSGLFITVVHGVPYVDVRDATVVYSAGNTYSVTLYNEYGELFEGVNVTFILNNQVYANVASDANGVAGFVVTNAPGYYKVTSQVFGLNITRSLNVVHIISLNKVKLKKSSKKVVIAATLKMVNGLYLKGKKIHFKFKNKNYYAYTDNKGVARITVKSKVLKKLKPRKKVTYQATYLQDTVKMTVKVKK